MSNMIINDKIHERAKIAARIREMVEAGVPEQANYDQAVADFDTLTKQIEDLRKMEAAEAAAPTLEIARKPAISDFRRFLQGEIVDAVSSDTSSMGYTIPEEMYGEIVRKLYDYGTVLDLATVVQTDTTMDIPVDGTAPTAYWIAEGGNFTDSSPTVSRVQLGAHKLGALIKVSEELLQDSAFDVESYVMSLTAEAMGVEMETQFVLGTMSNKPAGIVPNATQALTSSTTGSFTYADVLTLYTEVKEAYARRAEFLTNRKALGTIMGLTDGAGHLIFQPAYSAGEPDRLLGRPIHSSGAVPDASPLLFGDFKRYIIGLRGRMYMQRLNERYAETGQVGFRVWQRVDGKLTLAEAMKKLVCK